MPDNPSPDGVEASESSAFKRTLTRVLLVQAVTLVLLWLLQARFGL